MLELGRVNEGNHRYVPGQPVDESIHVFSLCATQSPFIARPIAEGCQFSYVHFPAAASKFLYVYLDRIVSISSATPLTRSSLALSFAARTGDAMLLASGAEVPTDMIRVPDAISAR